MEDKLKAEKLKEILNYVEENNISAYSIAKETGISEAGIGKIINGASKNPQLRTLEKIHAYLFKNKAEKCNINKSISMHMAKHSFADYAVKNDVGLLMISKLLGHTKLSTTQHYLKDFYHKEQSDTMNELFS